MAERTAKTDQWIKASWAASLPGRIRRRGRPGRAESAFTAHWASAFADWQTAIETVDGQIAALQSALRNDDNPQLHKIAETGLNAVTGNHKVPLMAALMDVDRAAAPARAAACAKAQQLALDFGLHISTDPRIAACDKNPFAVPVSVGATLGPALARLDTALRQEIVMSHAGSIDVSAGVQRAGDPAATARTARHAPGARCAS